MSEFYTPPDPHSVEFNFRLASYSPPNPHNVIFSFNSGALYCTINVPMGSVDDLQTGKTLASSLSSGVSITATLGDDFEEAIYVDNFMILVV